MSTSYSDSVTDFNMDFFHPTPSSTVSKSRIDKQRKAILIVKKKTIATNTLIKRYNAKSEALETAEKSLFSAKEECKQICIDYRKSVDTCSSLEKDLLQLKDTNKELESKYSNLESQFQAVSSHANQLQILVKEHETLIEALKIENKLNKGNDKDCKKTLQPLQKENNMLIRHICLARDIIFGKIKCRQHHKILLKKYDKYKSPTKDDSLFGEEECNNDYGSDEIVLSPFFEDEDIVDHDSESVKDKTEAMTININNSNIAAQNGISNNVLNDCNDVASIDTGRGSSLAFSVSDKSFHSPEYFINDSPLSDDSELNKIKPKLIDSSTSPVSYCFSINVSTSPIVFERDIIKTSCIMIDRALSPMEIPAGDGVFVSNENQGIPLSMKENIGHENNMISKTSIEVKNKCKERECLELNNSDIVSNENSNDCEIEMILSNMRLHNELITPIPATPAKSHSPNRDSIHHTPIKQRGSKNVCSEAVLAREENKKLQASISELAKELINIKKMLIGRPTTVQNEDIILNNELCSEDSINDSQVTSLVQVLSIDAQSHKTKDNKLALTEKSIQYSNSRSLDMNVLESSNNESSCTVPELENNESNSSTLQCEDIIENTIEKDVELVHATPEACYDNVSVDKQSVTKGDTIKFNSTRRKKITKLGKLKQKFLPKYKIKKEHLSLKKRNVKLKQLSNSNKKKIITASDSSATLNNKNVYEKAVKVMTDLKRKNCTDIENELVRLSEKNETEKILIDNVECTINEKSLSNPIQMSPNSTKSRSTVNMSYNLCKDLNFDRVEKDGHTTDSFKPPESRKNLKRMNVSENVGSEIPCKRVFHNSALDCSKDMNPKIVLHRCEDLTADNEYSPSKAINSSPKNKPGATSPEVSPKKPECQIGTQDLFNNQTNHIKDVSSPQVSPKIVENLVRSDKCIISNRRKSNKDTNSIQGSPKSTEIQGTSDVSNSTNSIRRSVRVLSFTGGSPKVQENQSVKDSQNLTNPRRTIIKDVSTTFVCPKVNSECNDNENSFSSRRNSKDMFSSEVSPKIIESQERTNTSDIISNRRKSVRLQSLSETSPKALEHQEKKYNEGIVNHQHKTLKDILSPIAKSKVTEYIERNNNRDHTSNQRNIGRELLSLGISPNDIERQKQCNIADNNTLSNRRKSVRLLSSSEISLKARNDNPDITTHARKNTKHISSPVVNHKATQFQVENHHQDVTMKQRKSSETSPCESENQRRDASHVKQKCERISSEFTPMSPASKERNGNQANNLRKEICSLGMSLEASDDQERSSSQSICYKKRKIDLCIPEISKNTTDNHNELSCNQYAADNPRESVLCRMIQQYGVKSVKYRAKKVSDSIINSTAKKIEDGIVRIIELPAHEAKEAMNKFVMDIQNWDIKHFLAGLMKYLKDPDRKMEMFNKVTAGSAPPLTKSEQVLLYVISELNKCWHSMVVDKILQCIEYTLFSLNRTPQIDVIESMSHFYAALCRYFKMKTRLRLFVLDAMYCIQFKAVPLIKQCIEVWTHILPLAHTATAQNPLVTCLVYLLHFYKCEDKYNRVQEIRNILSRKYFYKVTEWNETKILELFRNSIKSLKDTPAETKMLRIALIILAKRHGPRWCQNNIVKSLLQPIIEKQNNPEHVKAFCVSMLGPLLKPFPADMKVHCEIIMNQLTTMLEDNPSPKLAEAVVASLIYINKHNQFRVIQALAVWKPQKMSLELEDMLKDFVKSKPVKIWKSTLSKVQ